MFDQVKLMEANTQTHTVSESTIIERVARIVSNMRASKPDYTSLAAELQPAIPFDSFGVVLLRHDRLAVRVTLCQQVDGRWKDTYHQHPFEDSMLEQLVLHPTIKVENYPDGLDGIPSTCGDALSGSHQLRSTCIAPLMVGDHVLGSLELGSMSAYAYEDETLLRLIEAVVRVIAAAIDGAQVGGSAEILDRQRQALKDVSSALTSKTDLPAILCQIVEGVAHSLNVSSAIVMFNQRTGSLRLGAQAGMEPTTLQKIVENIKIGSEEAIIPYTLRRRQPCFSNDIGADERFPLSKAFATQLGIRSIFSYPLITGATVYGALLLCSPEPGGFTPLKADILSLFASQATIAIHNGLLIASAHQRASFQKAIEQLEYAQAHNLDDHELLARVYAQSRQAFGVSLSSLLQFISDHLLTLSERNLHDTLFSVEQETLPLGEELVLMQYASAQTEAFSPPNKHVNADVFAFHEESVAFLTQKAEVALARAKEFSELSHALSQLKQKPGHHKDALFALDLSGHCIYMNPAAEVFCGMHVSATAGIPIEKAFAEVIPNIRNIDETLAFFQGFQHGTAYAHELRCVLALEPLHKPDISKQAFSTSTTPSSASSLYAFSKATLRSHTSLLPDSIPTDSYYQFFAFPLFDRHGTLIANGLQIHDVTEQARNEKNKAALLSSVSHELRTPLTTIKAAVTGLLQSDIAWDEETRRELLADINVETDHLAVLVNAIIEMSRIEMGVLVLDKTWCDSVEILDGALTRLAREHGDHAIRLDILPDLPLIYVDHLQIERVFSHLLENAVHYSPAGAEILVSLDTVNVHNQLAPQHHQYLRAKIFDRGTGVLPGERERVFKSFYGGSSNGLGLGLAICKGIIEAHQGKIGVEDPPDGMGCCFTFTIPVFPHVDTSSLYDNSSVMSNRHAAFTADFVETRERAAPGVVPCPLQNPEGQQ
jgi:signal transduction histidine kinase/transcriptional regulator with GAF, ATPase, and Fis domain